MAASHSVLLYIIFSFLFGAFGEESIKADSIKPACSGLSEGEQCEEAPTPVILEKDGDFECPPNEMILIKGGVFTMGTDKPVFAADGEGPSRQVQVSAFYIDRYEVSNKEFEKFVEDTQYVTETESFEFSFVLSNLISEKNEEHDNSGGGWLSLVASGIQMPLGCIRRGSTRPSRTGPTILLSTSHGTMLFGSVNGVERDYLLRQNGSMLLGGDLKTVCFPGGNKENPKGEHWMNIWQGEFPDKNTVEDGYIGTAPVCMFPPNKYGLHNMAGNVWEWVSDWWKIRHKPEFAKDPKGPENGKEKVKKGGSYLCHKDYCYRYRCAARSQNTPDSSAGNLGFRCARTA